MRSYCRYFTWCNARMKREGLGMTLLFLVCFCAFLWWPNRLDNHGVIARIGPRGDVSCQNCERSTVVHKEPVRTVQEDMQHRRDTISQVCRTLPAKHVHTSMNHAMASRRHRFLYCPVEKTASTFWRRFMYQIVLTEPMQSPFDVSVQTVYSGRFPSGRVQVTEQGKELEHLLQNSTKMVFVREPYSRLLSAYVDKLISPNPILWRMWGRPAIELCIDPKSQKWCKDRSISSAPDSTNAHHQGSAPRGKSGSPPARVICGEDVTFPEFVKLSTSRLAQENFHVMPIFRLCSPCYANYTVVGHMETFSRDVKHLLPKIHVSEKQVNLDAMDDNVAYDAIEDSVHDSMSTAWLKRSLRCISKMDVVRRIWRKLQIRGFVSWRIIPANFHLDPTTVDTLDGPRLTKILVEANWKSANRTELKLQKKQALKEAYSMLQPEQFLDISETFGPDFKLFGFEENPKAFEDFRRPDFIYTGAFDLTKDWNMERVL